MDCVSTCRQFSFDGAHDAQVAKTVHHLYTPAQEGDAIDKTSNELGEQNHWSSLDGNGASPPMMQVVLRTTPLL